MGAAPIAHKIMGVMQQNAGRAMHVSEIANLAGLTAEQVTGCLSVRINNGDEDIRRGPRRGTYQYVSPRKAKAAPRKTAEDIVKEAGMHVSQHPAKPEAAAIPDMLEVLGVTEDGKLMARDPDTRKMYVARAM